MKLIPKVTILSGLAVSLIFLLGGNAISGTLSGMVEDNVYNNPVPDVEVSVFHSDSLPAGNTMTGSDGTYSITLDAGEYYAIYSKTSYADTTISDITITPDGITTVDLTFRFVFSCDYIVGDVNGSNSSNGLDVVYGVAYFKWGTNPPMNCLCECTPGRYWYVCGDLNGDCAYNGVDIIYAVTIGPGRLPIPCPDCPPAD